MLDSDSSKNTTQTTNTVGSSMTTYGTLQTTIENKYYRKLLEKVSKFIQYSGIVVGFYVLLTGLFVILLGIGAFDVYNYDNFAIYCILLLNLIGSMLGATCVYKFGPILEHVDRLEKNVDIQENEVKNLEKTYKKLQSANIILEEESQALKELEIELNQELHKFEALEESLQQTTTSSKSISEMLDTLTDTANNIREVVLDSEKARLLVLYYQTEMRDGESGLSKTEYKRFLDNLPKKQRERFEKLSTFEQIAAKDGIIHLSQFKQLIETFLDEYENDLVRESV